MRTIYEGWVTVKRDPTGNPGEGYCVTGDITFDNTAMTAILLDRAEIADSNHPTAATKKRLSLLKKLMPGNDGRGRAAPKKRKRGS